MRKHFREGLCAFHDRAAVGKKVNRTYHAQLYHRLQRFRRVVHTGCNGYMVVFSGKHGNDRGVSRFFSQVDCFLPVFRSAKDWCDVVCLRRKLY